MGIRRHTCWILVVIGIGLFGALVQSAQYDATFETFPTLTPTERMAYYYAPPKSVRVEIGQAKLLVDLRHSGPLNITAAIPLTDGRTHYDVIDNLCIYWQLYGSWPNASMYQVRPTPMTGKTEWANFVLHLSIPSMVWQATDARAYVLDKRYFQTIPATTQLQPIQPTPTVDIGPIGMMGTPGVPTPYQADIVFPKVHVEWFRDTGQARLRAGNVVLHNDFGCYWDEANPNTLQIGSFRIDLASGTVAYTEGAQVLPTTLSVEVDDSPDNVLVLSTLTGPLWE